MLIKLRHVLHCICVYFVTRFAPRSQVVTNAGKTCLTLSGTNNTASRNTVFGCGQAAISISSGDVSKLTPGHTSVVGNTISNFSRIQRTYAAGVAFSGVSNYATTHAIHTAT